VDEDAAAMLEYVGASEAERLIMKSLRIVIIGAHFKRFELSALQTDCYLFDLVWHRGGTRGGIVQV
jgi:hypothetical protein